MKNVSLILLVSLCVGASSQAVPIVIKGGTLVDVRSGVSIQNVSIVIEGERITKVGSSKEPKIPEGAQIVDASGKWIVPGFMDMHSHVSGDESLPFEMYLANGVTTIRDPASNVTLSRLLRDDLKSGKKIGPRYFFSGPLLDGIPPVWAEGSFLVDTPERASSAANFLIDQGVDFLKVYNNVKEPELVKIVETAHGRGIRVAGHVPRTITMTRAVEIGIDCLEHVRITGRELLSPEEAEQLDFLPYAKREILLWQRFDLKSEKMKKLISFLAEKKVFMDVTLIIEYSNIIDSEEETRDKNNQFLSKELFESWKNSPEPEYVKIPPDLKQASVSSFKKRQQFVGLCYQAGVRIITGTDGPFLGSLLPGFGLHREFELLSEAGMKPLDILRAATVTSAEALGMEKDLGTIEEGKYADILVLHKDPAADVKNLRSIQMVFKGGQRFDPQALLKTRP